ncbi:hypothetical protein [Lacipirellula limnantheis]|nr:hypothetical protein [Lacipirellula limnantheis]
MGRTDKKHHRKTRDFMNARRAISALLPAIRRIARTPERFTTEVRAHIVDLISLGVAGPDIHLMARAISTLIALEAENQRRDHAEFRDWVNGLGPKPSFLAEPKSGYDDESGTASTGCKPARQAA